MKRIKFRYVFEGVKDNYHLFNFFTLKFIEKGKVKNTIRAHKNSGYELISRDLFTHLKGVNGAEIYEGDLVKTKPYNNDEIFIGKVIYHRGTSTWRARNRKGFVFLGRHVFEKVGNKYKNSDLLNINLEG